MLEAPKLNPATIAGSSKTIQRIVAPRMPMPTTVMPITPPLEKATRSALFRLVRAAAAVRMLALTAMRMPMNPASADDIAPTRYAYATDGSCSSRARPSASRMPAMTMTKKASTVYSRFRKALEPS